MKNFIGVKEIKAKPLTRGEYNEYRGWKIPLGENPSEEGYLVEYLDEGQPNHPNHNGYISWLPKDVFEKAYKEVSGLTFGLAVEAAKKGYKIARKGWNGKGMFLYYVPANKYPYSTEVGKSIADEDGKVEYGAYIAMKTVQENVVPWLASQTDVLAEDWMIIE